MEKIIILTDLGRFVAYKVTSDPMGVESPRIQIIRCMDCLDARNRTSDRVSDSAGRFKRAGKTANGTMGGYGERHNMESENRRRLIKMAAEQIDNVLLQEGMPRWALAASSKINNALLESLSQGAKASLGLNLKSDLTRLDKSKVLSRFNH